MPASVSYHGPLIFFSAAIIGNRASVVSFLKSRGAEADERALIRVLYKAIDEIDYCQLSRLLGYCDYLELPYWQGQFLLHRAVETGRKSCVRIMLESSVSQGKTLCLNAHYYSESKYGLIAVFAGETSEIESAPRKAKLFVSVHIKLLRLSEIMLISGNSELYFCVP